MRALIRLALICASLFAGTALAVIVWTFTWPETDVTTLAKADAILCLGGGLSADGALPAPVETRVARCVEVQAATGTPLVVFTDGTLVQGAPPAGEMMARYALQLGLPGSAALRETRARSTLQNMLYALQLSPRTKRLIIVTEAFHLPRSAASASWAAWQLGLPQPRVTLVMSEPVRQRGRGPSWRMLARESLALWFNAVRALAYSALPRAPESLLD